MADSPASDQAPKVTVLMSVYNSQRFLTQAIESILGQTFRDFEFLIVDDGSTDDSRKIVDEYAANDTRIRLIINNSNIGLTKSLNRGIEKAKGKYLARQDADDISLPNRFAKQVEFLDNNSQVGVLGTAYAVIDTESKTIAQRKCRGDHETLKADLLVKNHALLHSSTMIRTKLLLDAGGYDENIRFAQDYDLWWRLSSCTRLANIDDILTKWRESDDRISGKTRHEQLTSMLRISWNIVSTTLGSDQLNKECYERFWWAYNGKEIKFLSKNDLLELSPLWNLLSNQYDKPTSTFESINQLVYNLIRSGQYKPGLFLAQICMNQLSSGLKIRTTIKSLIGSMIRI